MRLPATAVLDGWPSARLRGCTEPGLQADSSAAQAADQQRYGYEALWPRIYSADYARSRSGQQTSCRIDRFRDLDLVDANRWKQAG
jgi:hypothetical protein